MHSDVVIIGCGPAGALAANLLARAGLSVTILERETDLNPLPRAVHLDHEMLRLFQSAGVIDRLLDGMRAADGHLHLGADGGVIRYMGTAGAPRPFGWANDYFFYQPELETHLRDGFACSNKVDLQLGASFAKLEQSDDFVRVHFEAAGTSHVIQARWVIGCDGARSSVRRALGIELHDLKFEEPWLVVDAEVDGPVTFPEIAGLPEGADPQRLSVMLCDPRRPATVVPGRGNHRRWEFMLLPGEDDKAMMEPAVVARLVGPWLANVPHRIVRAATYRFHGLVAKRWQVGRVFLAGDAAHQTPPFFGQGMCHGLRDVANLAWKMAAIVGDDADPALLNTYQCEREPHVLAIIGAAVASGRYICELDPLVAADRDDALRAAQPNAQAQTAADLIPPIKGGILLEGSPGAGERFIQPLIGETLLDAYAGQGWRLFVRHEGISGEGGLTRIDASALGDRGELLGWLDSHNADAVLVRPDHYVFGTSVGQARTLIDARNAALGLSLEAVA